MSFRLNLRLSLFLVSVVAGLYWPYLHNPLFFDDFDLFERGSLNQIFQNGFALDLRWPSYFTMAWIDLIFDDRIFAQRVTSLLIHLLTAFVFYEFVKKISNHVMPSQYNERASFAAVLLFLLHPLAVYSVGYLAQRTILMATLFGMMALSAYFDGLVNRKKSYFLFAALFYLLALFCKEHVVLLPLVALALSLMVRPGLGLWRSIVPSAVLCLAVAAYMISVRSDLLGRVYEPFAAPLLKAQFGQEVPDHVWLLSGMTQSVMFFKYLGLMLLPNPEWMSIDMRVPFAADVLDIKYLFAVLAFLTCGGASLYLLSRGGRWGLAGFALLSYWLMFLIEFSVVRIQEPFVLYRSYFWLAMVLLLVPAASVNIKDKVFWPALLILAAFCFWSSNDRLKSFSSEFALWDDAVQKLPSAKVPGIPRIYANRGYEYVKMGKYREAISDFTSTLNVDPKYKKAYQMRAFSYSKLGQHEQALQDANAIIRLYPDDPLGYTVRGVAYRSKGDYPQSMADLDRACKLKWFPACVAQSVTRQQLEAKSRSE